MSHNTYRGIEIARNSMSDALEQMERLRFAKQNDEAAEYDDEEDEDGTPPNEYEMKALPKLINSCIEALDLYFDAISMGHIELHPRIDVQKLVAMVKSINDEE